jgi:hypothetical protein
MKWQLTEPHHIDEQVLPIGTIIGDDTNWAYRATKADPKIGRKVGDALPPSTNMIPVDDEARQAYDKKFQGQVPEGDPTKSIPLTGAPDSPRVPGVAPQPKVTAPAAPNPAPKDDAPKTGMIAPNPGVNAKPPAGHDSSKNPGDSKDTETAKTPDVKKL